MTSKNHLNRGEEKAKRYGNGIYGYKNYMCFCPFTRTKEADFGRLMVREHISSIRIA